MPRDSGYEVHREVYQSRLRLAEDGDSSRYRAVSGLAIIGFLAGLLGLLALVVPLAWAVAVAATLVNLKALDRIKKNAPALLGRKVALAGLALSVVVLFAAPVDWVIYRRLVRQEARQFAEMWFQFLRTGQPHKAHQLTIGPTLREPLDGKLWDSYREGSEGLPIFKQYLQSADVRTLLALGDKATVRYYSTESQSAETDRDKLYQTYAVTFPDSDGLKTFFVGLQLERTIHIPTGHAYWQIGRTYGGVRPGRFGGDGSPPRG